MIRSRTMKLVNDIREIFAKDKKLFLLTNAYYFGLVILGGLIALAFPQTQQFLLNLTTTGLSVGPFSELTDAYLSGDVLYAAAATFITNLLVGTLAVITVPSLVVPIWAPFMGMVRATEWGILLVVPIPGVLPLGRVIPHYLTMLIEGEAYVVAIFACLRQVKVLMKLGSIPPGQRLKAYWGSIVDNVKLLPVVAILLAVAAIYEAWEVMYFAGILK
jgi:hypothetical protein